MQQKATTMAKFAMLDVYSGVPNPVWPIADDLAEQMNSVGGGEAGQGLGYRGFKIIEAQTDVSAATTADAIGDFTQSTVVFGNSEAEKQLLEAGVAAGAINDDLFGYVSQTIGGGSPSGGAAMVAGNPGCPPCGGGDAPSYDPNFWNDPARQPRNNCYNYANNNPTNTFAQPGRGTGQVFGSLDCDGVRQAAERDGMVTTDTYQASRPGWYVALVIWPGQDYHWYRQDDVGCWSHKPGQTAARNVDSSGAAITDPNQCDRGPYTICCTYMVSSSGVTIS